jgi:hypothetical protein
LGGLGDTEGPPVTYNWTAAGLISPLLPWLAILALLALKPNHGWSAWWIWLPLACLAAGWHCLELVLQSSNTGLPKGMLEIILDVPVALAFGLAALWLLASHLGRRHRFGTFLGSLLILVVFTVFSFAAAAGWNTGLEPVMSLLDPRRCSATAGAGEMALPFLVLPLVLALVVAAAMFLCGLACRWRHRPWWLCLWLFLSLPTAWVAVSALLHALCRMASPDSVNFDLLLVLGPFMVALIFATLLPFLVLSRVNALFRERLKNLFHLEPQKSILQRNEQEKL